jgi:oligopeptide/dipeptide ABC transporter ATP-binding protein
MPSGVTAPDRPANGPVLSVRGLRKHFPLRRSVLETAVGRLRGLRPLVTRAVDDVSFDVRPSEALGLVGESGCGKTTLGWSILRLIEPTSGQVIFRGQDLAGLPRHELRSVRPRMQIIFQDPTGSLNARKTAGQAMERGLAAGGVRRRVDQRERLASLLQSVGLEPQLARRYPHELSGGQKQRVSIGRALATGPELLIADEPVSSLDVSVQAQILNLIVELQHERGLALLFISHDLSVVRQVSDRIAVMYAGRIVEIGPTDSIIGSPRHPYAQALIDAVPRLHEHRHLVARGPRPISTPAVTGPPTGCSFQPRCSAAQTDACREVAPELTEVAPGHAVACHLCT